MNTISIQVPSIMENIRMIESFIDNAKEKFDLNDDIYGNIMIAVTEAVNKVLSPVASCASRQSFGGTAPDQVRARIADWKGRLA